MRFFTRPIVSLWRYRWLLRQTALTDLRARYAGSALGLVWLLLAPLLFLSCYALVYLCIYRLQPTGMSPTDYVLMIGCGLVPFLSFAEAINTGTGCLTSNAQLIRNTLFPPELLPVKAVLVSQPTQVVGTGLLLTALVLTGKLTGWVLLLPLLWLFQLLLTVGFVWVLSTCTVLLRDIQQMIAVLMLILLMLSPITYTMDMVPGFLRPFLYLNPLSHLIVCYQCVLLKGKFPPLPAAGMLTAMAACSFFGGFWVFTQIKKVLADHA